MQGSSADLGGRLGWSLRRDGFRDSKVLRNLATVLKLSATRGKHQNTLFKHMKIDGGVENLYGVCGLCVWSLGGRVPELSITS